MCAISVDEYLKLVGKKLQLAEQVLKRGGVTERDGAARLTNDQQFFWRLIVSGYITHISIKTDPISPSAWW